MNVLLQVGALFFLMAIGYLLGIKKLIEGNAIRGMSNLIVKATLPALVLMSLQKPFSADLLAQSLQTLLVASLFYIAIIGLSLLVSRALYPNNKTGAPGAAAFSLAFSNAAFVGFPVITSIMGEGSLFLASIHNILFNVLAFSVGILMIAADKTGGAASAESRPAARIPVKRIFNINVVSALLGFLFFFFSIAIPQAIALPLTMLGSMTTPLAMIVTGAMLSRTPLGAVMGDWRLYAVSAVRLAAWPLLTAIALRAAGVSGELYLISIIIAGMPAASNTSLLAEVYGGDSKTASSIVFMTTLLSVITIPVMGVLLSR
ncbi:MAG: AEC family transporter [Spirochaetales bacterium]|nr:AEC family transporter [Spirochaetales bacterium]